MCRHLQVLHLIGREILNVLHRPGLASCLQDGLFNHASVLVWVPDSTHVWTQRERCSHKEACSCVCSHVHRVPLSELLSVFGYVWEWPGVCVQGCLQRFTMRARVCEQRQHYGIYLGAFPMYPSGDAKEGMCVRCTYTTECVCAGWQWVSLMLGGGFLCSRGRTQN